MTRKFRTGRFHSGRKLAGPPETEAETQRSVERPPSRLSAVWIFQSVGEPSPKAAPSFARVHTELLPTHQRLSPSQSINVRTAGFPPFSPETERPFSTSSGPAWRSSRELVSDGTAARREMARCPDGDSVNTPLPKEERFQDPAALPSEMTLPSGAPSGVKNPAFTAARPSREAAADRASGYFEPGPPGWSITARR